MKSILLVLNIKAQTFLTSAFDTRPRVLMKNLSSVVIFGGVAVGVFILSRATTLYLLQQAQIGQFLFHRFLSMLLYVFFITVNLGNMIVCYATLFRSAEVSFLMGLPISHARVFWIKFIDNFFYSSSTLTLLGLAWLLGYGSYFALPWYFYFFTMFFVLMPFMLLSGIIAVIILMALIKVATKIGVRWLLSGVTFIYLLAIYLYFHFTNPIRMVQEVMKHYPNVNEYFGYLDAPVTRYLPNHWVAEFLYWSINGESVRAMSYFFLLMGTLLILVAIAASLAGNMYYRSWSTAMDARAKQGSHVATATRATILDFGGPSFFRSQMEVIIRRDFWAFLREPSQWLHLLLMMLLLLIFLTSMNSLQVKLTQPFMQMVSFLVVFLFGGFMIASVCLRFVFPAVSLEGEAFWIVRSSPVSLRRLYWHKFTTAFALVLGVGELLALVSTALLRDSGALTIVAVILTFFMALALTSMNLASGAAFAVYNEKNPIRIASSQGASLTFLGSLLYLGFVALVIAIPLEGYFALIRAHGPATKGWILIPVLGSAAVSLLVFAVSTRIGLKAMTRDL
jgi:ABC-2 type transport system permease protein